ncbi:MAG: phospholipase D-like domain-containing protein [Prevotellaceae bacterium]|nr:phospholipase D-like domain-containing protein [Prevotellaceae bacterium]
MQIRVYPKQNLHAKIYIFREQEKHAHGYGSGITGSSNLTDSGLQHNFEFNVELRDDADNIFPIAAAANNYTNMNYISFQNE